MFTGLNWARLPWPDHLRNVGCGFVHFHSVQSTGSLTSEKMFVFIEQVLCAFAEGRRNWAVTVFYILLHSKFYILKPQPGNRCVRWEDFLHHCYVWNCIILKDYLILYGRFHLGISFNPVVFSLAFDIRKVLFCCFYIFFQIKSHNH